MSQRAAPNRRGSRALPVLALCDARESGALVDELVRALASRGDGVIQSPVASASAARRAIADAEDVARVVVVGPEALFTACLEPLLAAGRPVGFVGTHRSDLGEVLGLPEEPLAAALATAAGTPQRLRLLRADGRPVLGHVHVVTEGDASDFQEQPAAGGSRWLRQLLGGFERIEPADLTLITDDATERVRAGHLVAQVGQAAPKGPPVVDAVALPPITPGRAILWLGAELAGADFAPEVWRRRSGTLTVSSPRSLPVLDDRGGLIGETPLTLGVDPRPLIFLAPDPHALLAPRFRHAVVDVIVAAERFAARCREGAALLTHAEHRAALLKIAAQAESDAQALAGELLRHGERVDPLRGEPSRLDEIWLRARAALAEDHDRAILGHCHLAAARLRAVTARALAQRPTGGLGHWLHAARRDAASAERWMDEQSS